MILVAHCGGNLIIMKHKRPLPGYLGAKQKPHNPRVVYTPLKISQIKCKDESVFVFSGRTWSNRWKINSFIRAVGDKKWCVSFSQFHHPIFSSNARVASVLVRIFTTHFLPALALFSEQKWQLRKMPHVWHFSLMTFNFHFLCFVFTRS